MTPEDFLNQVWLKWTKADGMSIPLPELWKIRVTYIPANAADWDFAVRKAMEASNRNWKPIADDAIFNYSVGIVWRRLGEISPIDSSPMLSVRLRDPDEDWVPPPPPETWEDAQRRREEESAEHARRVEERKRREAERFAALVEAVKGRDDLMRTPLTRWHMAGIDEGRPSVQMPKIHRKGGSCGSVRSGRAEPYMWPESGLDEAGKTPEPCHICFKKAVIS